MVKKNRKSIPKQLSFFYHFIEHAKAITYTDMPRQVIEDVVKAIKFKLNNEEQAWKKQNDNTPQKDI